MVALPVELSSLTRTKDAFVSRDWQRTYLQVVLFCLFAKFFFVFPSTAIKIMLPIKISQSTL